MEREFGAEIADTFGVLMRRMYEADERSLPAQIAICLERLKHAEDNQSGTASADVSRSREPEPACEARVLT
jgi:hypothetical protein